MTKLPSLVSALVMVALLTVSLCEGQIICSTMFPLTGKYAREGGIEEAALRKAVFDINTKNPVTLFGFPAPLGTFSTDSESSISGALSASTTFPSSIVVFTSSDREIAEAVAPIFLSLSLLHYTLSSSEALTQYPNVVQMVPSERHQGTALADLIHHFNWDFSVGVFSSSTPYGSEILSEFVSRSGDIGLTILASQQFYPGTQELWQIVETVKISQARVIVNIMDVSDMRTIVRHADRLDMLTDKYVWLCSDACATDQIFRDPKTNKVDEKTRDKLVGMIGMQFQTGHGELYERFLDEWENEDPFLYAGAGKRESSFYAPHAYDALSMFANVITLAFSNPNSSITIGAIVEAQKAVKFQGLTGLVTMEETGRERIAVFDIVNLRSDSLKSGYKGFVVVGNWNETQGSSRVGDISDRIDFVYDLQFRDGSYNLPDLDIRNSYDYWSCNDGEMKTDETGKSVRLEKPDGQGADNIAKHYRCDQFIDCYNMSDEWGCPVSFPVLFIVYGIFLFIFICFALFCLLFTCVFGFCIRRKRIRASSPTFLIIICLAAIFGYGGLFSFFGQPHTVSCNFRIWLLAVAVITAISALLVKSFRVWRLYRSPTEIKALRDWQLVLFVIASVVPVLVFLVLWTGLATPTAMLLEARKDNEEHLQCSYGSVAGVIGFYFFFFAIVAYVGLFLLFGVFLSIATRNVVSTFNESRLIAISIYNITFSAIVTIPIVFVLKDSDPLITWIIIVTAFAYGFTATLVLQFVPKVWGVVVRDRFGNNTPTHSSAGASTEHKDSSVGSKDSMAIF